MSLDKENISKALNIIALSIVVFVVLYIAIGFITNFFGIGFIRTQSIDKQVMIYRKDFENRELKDKLIYFLLPKDTPYFTKFSNFAKYVRCKDGDMLSVKGLEYFCNGKLIGVAKTKDKNGKEVKPFVFDGIIPQGKYFVMGTHERSYDSRYWGFVDKNLIQGVSIWEL
ncbi:S26 family signal peptidase [Campylobacter sp. MIT 12-8780]|uniref:S26 family signal peptidase n=1 Tax=unclassified Campylobacter TaxID=2593542 RepID=UPI00115D0A5E|nr:MULTISPECIES: S26 family signal peptidase [unclassified Campylobacter]NDJ27688.1 S26 family signal peptidase [Campylobacter sp. MIT 19-121]TQR40852.1 S26 family signal peptidase [Campylobacter sp. MIT 12-8780]